VGIVHIQKCGGTNLKQVMVSSPDFYGGPRYWGGSAFQRSKAFVSDRSKKTKWAPIWELSGIVDDHAGIIGHYTGSTLIEAGCSTILFYAREPRSRVISQYRFWQIQGKAYWQEQMGEAKGAEFAEMLDAGFGSFLRSESVTATHARTNHIARRLLDLPGRPDPTPETLVERWDQFSPYVVGGYWINQTDDFLARITAETGIPLERPNRAAKNVTPKTAEPEQITKAELAMLDECTAVDQLLLERMMEDGILSPRSKEELDNEFAALLAAHHIEIVD